MTRIRRPLGLASLVLLGACVAGPGGPAPAGRALPAAITPQDSRIVLAPPGVSKPAITAAQAYDLCKTGVAECEPTSPSEVDLTLVTDPDFGTNDSNGVFRQRLKGTLAWAIVWTGFACPPSSAAIADPTPSPTSSREAPLCDKFSLVDASTGEFLYSYLYPHG